MVCVFFCMELLFLMIGLVFGAFFSRLFSITKLHYVCDFNQFEMFENNLGVSNTIRGWECFMDWRSASNLISTPFVGPRFTWTNKQLGSNLIMEHLDMVYVTPSWTSMFPRHKILHEPITCSDHAAIIYLTFIVAMVQKGPYQLEKLFSTKKRSH